MCVNNLSSPVYVFYASLDITHVPLQVSVLFHMVLKPSGVQLNMEELKNMLVPKTHYDNGPMVGAVEIFKREDHN